MWYTTMPTILHPTFESVSRLPDARIERELKVAAVNAEKNRSIQINKQQQREPPRFQRALPALPTLPELTVEKVDALTKTGAVDVSKQLKDICFTLVDQDSLDMPESGRQVNDGEISMASIEDLIRNWANTITFFIFQQNKTKQSFVVETREHQGGQLVLM